MKLQLRDLQLYVFSGQGIDSRYQEIYNTSFKTWKLVWQQALRELDGVDKIHSDGFTRHNKIIAIFHKNECASLIAIRECDMQLPANREDSLLSAWDDDAFEKLMVEGSRVGICTYLSVNPSYRGEVSTGILLKDVIMGLAVKALLDSDCDVMTGTMRCNRGTHKSAYLTGADFIKKSTMHEVEVDLVGFFKKRIQRSRPLENQTWVNTLWAGREDLQVSFEVNQKQAA